METTATFLKQNYDLIMLLVGVLGVIISIMAVAVEIKKKKSTKNNKKNC